jgi:putative ABC transport system permease protein
MLKIWFKILFRNSQKNWLNLAVNISGLSLGLAGLIIVLLYFNDEKSYNVWNPFKDDIYNVNHVMPDGEVWATSTSVEGPAFVEEIPEVKDFYLSQSWYNALLVNVNGKSHYTNDILEGYDNFFSFFPFPITEGNADELLKSKTHMALSTKLALKYFGQESAIGKTLQIKDQTFTIVAVYQIVGRSYFEPAMVIQYQDELRKEWGSYYSNLFCKLKKGADPKVVESKMNAIFEKYEMIPGAEENGIPIETFREKYGVTVIIDPLSEIRLHARADDGGPEGKGNYQLLMIMLALSVLLIIISSVNFVNLTTASAFQRAKEVGIKKTLGMSKMAITGYFVLEVMLQAITALILALISAELILPYINSYLQVDLSLMQPRILIQMGALTIIISILVGIIPSWYAANYKAVDVLKGNYSRSKKGIFVRQSMLGVQFLISGFFLIGAMVMYEQVSFMIHQDMGFNGDQVVIIYLNERENAYSKYELVKKELIKHPNIVDISSNSYVPGGSSSSTTNLDYEDRNVNANANTIDFNYLDFAGIKLIKGRALSSEYASDTINNVLINEITARSLGIFDDPINKKIDLGYGKNMNIVGVVGDYFVDGVDVKINQMFMYHWKTFVWGPNSLSNIQFKIAPQDVPEMMAIIEQFWKESVEQEYPFSYRFLNDQFARTYERYEKQQTMFGILTGIVIVVALLGLFALATLTIQQRLKEVAIRKTLGASVKSIVFQLIKTFVKVTTIASMFLIPVTYYVMQNWLSDFIYRIEMPWWPYIVTPVILIILVLIIVGIKALNATKVSLIQYLKFE